MIVESRDPFRQAAASNPSPNPNPDPDPDPDPDPAPDQSSADLLLLPCDHRRRLGRLLGLADEAHRRARWASGSG